MKKVLITEDDKFLSKAYQAMMAKYGFEAVIALDGEEVLDKITNYQPDIMILDLKMPKKDGFEVLQEIKNIPDFPKIPILVISNLSQKEEKDRVLALGATEYIVKSDITIPLLINKIQQYTGLPLTEFD